MDVYICVYVGKTIVERECFDAKQNKLEQPIQYNQIKTKLFAYITLKTIFLKIDFFINYFSNHMIQLILCPEHKNYRKLYKTCWLKDI